MDAPRGERSVCTEAACPLRADEAVFIARTLGVTLASFVVLAPSAGSGFRLAPGAAALRHELRLRKVEHAGHAACVFALPLHGGRTICGLGGLAPQACGGPPGLHLESAEGRSRALAAEARWHAALDAGPNAASEETLSDYLLDAFADLWPAPGRLR